MLTVNRFVQLGGGSNVKILDAGNIEWQSELTEALPLLYFISGCDYVSALNMVGKWKGLSTLEKGAEYVDAMNFLGENWNTTENLFTTIENIVCIYMECFNTMRMSGI